MNHTKPSGFSSDGGLQWHWWWRWRWRGYVYEMVIRADRRREGGRSPSRTGDEAATYLEVYDLIKAKLVYANKSKALVIWNYYIPAHIQCIHKNCPREEHLLVPQNYPKWKEK